MRETISSHCHKPVSSRDTNTRPLNIILASWQDTGLEDSSVSKVLSPEKHEVLSSNPQPSHKLGIAPYAYNLTLEKQRQADPGACWLIHIPTHRHRHVIKDKPENI